MKTLRVLVHVAALLLTAPPTTFVSGLSTMAPTISRPIGTRVEWQDALLQKYARPLVPTPFSEALETLQRDGVVRIDGRSVDPEHCRTLRSKILDEMGKDYTSSCGESMMDKKYVPGTRLRFDAPMDLAFAGDVRHDLLLPLHNNLPELQPVLRSAVSQLESLLESAAESLLPRLHGSSSIMKKQKQQPRGLEVVEVASLVVRPGSGHQAFHGDYRRFPQSESTGEEEPLVNTRARMGKLPPRLVSFVALQDVPTNEHGATCFVTGTNNAKAHEIVYAGQGIAASDECNDEQMTAARRNRESILEMSNKAHGIRTTAGMRRGDMLIYDASVLHWGGANSVPNNDRAMLYFGVASPGAAAMLCEKPSPSMESFEIVPPVLLEDVSLNSKNF